MGISNFGILGPPLLLSGPRRKSMRRRRIAAREE
jgi:hypothetical protein